MLDYEVMASPRRSSSLLAASLAALIVSVALGIGPAHAAGAAPAPGIVLTHGATYRARLKLSFFQCLASKGQIGRKFSGSGFANVRVFMSARELPGNWPAAYRPKAGGCARYAEGTWSRQTAPRARPSSIDAWWVAPAP